MADLVYMHKDKWTDHLDAIRAKAGTSDTMTVDEATTAVEGISGGTDTSDATLNSGGQMLSGVTAYSKGTKYTGTIPTQAAATITPTESAQTAVSAGKYTAGDVTVGAIPSDYIGTDIPRRSSISVSQDDNTIHVEDGYYANDIDTTMGACTVTGASVLIDNQGDATGSIIVGRGGYINSGSHAFYVEDVVTPRSSSDLTASGATVSVPYGYYSADASKTVASGSAGTPTATKGSVSNHAVNVTPSVTNTTGYITGGTVTGTAVSVSASELVSGNKAITENGTGIDVANYSTVSVDVQGVSPSGTKNISITTNGTTTEDVTSYATASITTNVPNSYSASDEGKVVSSGALVAQTSDTVTTNDTYDTTLINSLTVNVSGGGGISVDDLATNTQPSGAITLGSGVTEIKNYAFAGKPITSITGSSVTKFNQYSFQDTSITDITDSNFPSLGVSSRFNILLRMSSLKHIKLSGGYIALNNGSYALRDNTALITAEFPNAGKEESNQRGTTQYFMASCSKLELADIGQVNQISGFGFNGDSVLTTLILRSATVVTLSNTSAFNNTPFKNGGTGGTIYIPKALYDHLGDGTSSDYQHASNWSTVHGYGTITWAKIEGSIYELT